MKKLAYILLSTAINAYRMNAVMDMAHKIGLTLNVRSACILGDIHCETGYCSRGTKDNNHLYYLTL
jgi:hypothetical protein